MSRRGPPVAQPGTVAHKAIAYLQTKPEGYECSSAVLADAIGQPHSGFGQYLRVAVEQSMLNRRIEGRIAMWSLGSGAPERVKPPEKEPVLPKGERVSQPTFPALSAPSIFAFAAERGAAPFSVSISTDGRMTIERHGRLMLELTAEEAATLRKVNREGIRP